MTDISREACEITAAVMKVEASSGSRFGQSITQNLRADLILALRAAIDRAEADAVARVKAMWDACATAADNAAQHDWSQAEKWPDEGRKYEDRAHRAETIAAAIRAITPPAPMTVAVAAKQALREIASQKKTDEMETEYDVEVADFEGGYDACIDRARAALAAIGEPT